MEMEIKMEIRRRRMLDCLIGRFHINNFDVEVGDKGIHHYSRLYCSSTLLNLGYLTVAYLGLSTS